MMRRRALLTASISDSGGGSNEGPININNYLTIEALENNLSVSVEGSAGNYEYCIDGDGCWRKKITNSATEVINTGQTISFRASTTSRIIHRMHCSRRYNLVGNCMSIIFGDDAANSSSLIGYDYIFDQLFFNNTNLVSVSPSFLPATTLADSCYSNMFHGCNSLTTAPELPATILSDDCYDSMFHGCNSLTTAPELPATTLDRYCYRGMFSGCRNLKYIKMLATDISATNCLYNWVNNVSSTGTFVKNLTMTSLPTGNSGIPSGWTVVDDGEESGGRLT